VGAGPEYHYGLGMAKRRAKRRPRTPFDTPSLRMAAAVRLGTPISEVAKRYRVTKAKVKAASGLHAKSLGGAGKLRPATAERYRAVADRGRG
jgi:hypothetical protein